MLFVVTNGVYIFLLQVMWSRELIYKKCVIFTSNLTTRFIARVSHNIYMYYKMIKRYCITYKLLFLFLKGRVINICRIIDHWNTIWFCIYLSYYISYCIYSQLYNLIRMWIFSLCSKCVLLGEGRGVAMADKQAGDNSLNSIASPRQRFSLISLFASNQSSRSSFREKRQKSGKKVCYLYYYYYLLSALQLYKSKLK